MNIVLIGPPGVGKGTQAALLEARTGLKHVASGDLLRRQMAEGTELGRVAKGYMDRGELVPDDVVIDMILVRVAEPDCATGVVFDGFPRTPDQARRLLEALAERALALDAVVALTAPRDVLLKRIAGRETCRLCQTPYNIFYTPSRLEAVCDLCGGELYTRSDDDMTTARHRLGVYQQQTLPLLSFFGDLGLLREVEAAADVEQVTERITAVLRADPTLVASGNEVATL